MKGNKPAAKEIDPPEYNVGRASNRYARESIPTAAWSRAGYDYNPDLVLSNKGKTLELYRRMRLDETVNAATLIHKEITLAGDWCIEPEDDSAEAVAQADFVKDVLDNLETIPFADVMDALLDMRWLGYVIAEPRWIADGKYWRIADIKCKDSNLFQFKVDPYGNLEAVHMLNTSVPDVDPSQLIIGVYPYVSNGNWYGTSAYQAIYASWWAKANILKYRNTYLQSRGGAPLMGIYPASQPSAKTAVEDAMDAVQNDFWASVPGHIGPDGKLVPDFAIEVIKTASEQGTAEFEKAIVQLDTSITRGLLLPDNLGFTTTGAGSFAQSKVQMQQVMYGIEKTRERLCDIVNDQIIRRLLAVNFERPTRARLKFEQPDDGTTETKARIVTMLTEKGIIDPGEDWVRPYLGIPTIEAAETNETIEADDEQESVDKESLTTDGKPAKMRLGPDGRYIRPFKLKEVKSVLDDSEAQALTRIADVFAVCTPDIVAQAQRAINSGKLGEVNNVSMRSKYTSACKDALLRSMYRVYLEGKAGTARDLREYSGRNASRFRDEERKRIMRLTNAQETRYSVKLKDLEDFVGMGYGGISQWLKQFGASLSAKDKQTLREMAERAYAVAGQDIAATLSDSVRQVLRTGWGKKTSAQLVAEVTDVISKFVAANATDPAVTGVSIADAVDGKYSYGRIKTIVRTNLTTEYNNGIMNQVLDPELQGFVEAMQYAAILDDVTTPFCEAHDGEIVAVGSPDYVLLNPPNHFGCRSTWMPVFKGEDWKNNWNTKSDKALDKLGLSKETYVNGYQGFGKG